METIFPYEICMKINMYAGHPISDILKESTIFKYLKLRNKNIHNDDYYNFLDGCEHAQERIAQTASTEAGESIESRMKDEKAEIRKVFEMESHNNVTIA